MARPSFARERTSRAAHLEAACNLRCNHTEVKRSQSRVHGKQDQAEQW